MNATNAPKPLHFMVRCTSCKTVARLEVPARHESKTCTRSALGERGPTIETYKRTVRVVDLGGCLGYLYTTIGAVLAGSRVACWDCGRALRFEQITGVFSAKHKCNAKCLASKGPQCECSCGGANHGGSYA
jgi:hypothetical protein